MKRLPNPTPLHRAIELAVRAGIKGLHTGLPGQLTAYDAQSGRAQVKPLIQVTDREGNLYSLPVIAGVPVVFPGGEAGSLFLPLRVGDTGWLAFAERSLELWLDRGGEQPPGDPRIMDLTDAVFFPGLRSFKQGPLTPDPDAAGLQEAGGATLRLKDGRVALGTRQAELLDLVSQLLTVIQTATNGAGPVVFTPAAGPGSIPDLALKLATIKGSL